MLIQGTYVSLIAPIWLMDTIVALIPYAMLEQQVMHKCTQGGVATCLLTLLIIMIIIRVDYPGV